MENFCQQLLKPLDAYMQGFPLSVCHFFVAWIPSVNLSINNIFDKQALTNLVV